MNDKRVCTIKGASGNCTLTYCQSNSIQRLNNYDIYHYRLIFPLDDPNHQLPGWLCLVLFPFLSRSESLLLLLSGFSSVNKLYLLLVSIFASIMFTLTSNFLALSWVFLSKKTYFGRFLSRSFEIWR